MDNEDRPYGTFATSSNYTAPGDPGTNSSSSETDTAKADNVDNGTADETNGSITDETDNFTDTSHDTADTTFNAANDQGAATLPPGVTVREAPWVTYPMLWAWMGTPYWTPLGNPVTGWSPAGYGGPTTTTGTLATDDESFTSTVAQAAAGAAETLAGDEQTWTDTVDPAEVFYVTTQGNDEVTSAQGIATAQAAYAYAEAELPAGEGDLPSPLSPGEGQGEGGSSTNTSATAFASAYQQAYATWISNLTPSFISDATQVAQADANDQDALAQAAENADEAGAAANVAFVNADAPAAASEATGLETASDSYATSVVEHLDQSANALAASDAGWMLGIAKADATYLVASAAADESMHFATAGIHGANPTLVAAAQGLAGDAQFNLSKGYADATLGQVTAQATTGQQFAQADATSWQTMIGGEATAIDAFSHADDAAVAGENDAVAAATGQLIQAVAQADADQADADATANDGFSNDEATQTVTGWSSLVAWASPAGGAPLPGLPWLGFESQQAQLLAQWQQTASSDDAQYTNAVGQQEIDYANSDAAAFISEAHTIDAADQQAADSAADADQTLTNGLAGDEVVYEDSAATATADWQIAAAQAGHDNAVALAQADDDYAHGLDWSDYLGERATAFTNLMAKQTLANNGFSEAMGAADATQTSSDAGLTLTNADQIADAVLADSIADDKAIDLYSRAESDAYDDEQKNDAQALWSQQTNDAIAYFNSLNNLNQSTPWGAQATAQAQAQMTLAVTLAQAALTLTDGTADAQDGQEDSEWDLQQSQSDALAQLAHDQAYSDAQATFNATLSQAAATAALAAVDGYFAALPDALGSWGVGGLFTNAPAPFTDNYDYMNNVDDISADGTMGWSWSVGPTGEPFALQANDVLNGATFWATAIQAPYLPPNPYEGQPNWAPPDDPTPVPPPPNGSWSENPPPVPDVGATVYASERQLSAKPGDAPIARQPGAATPDGTTPSGRSSLGAAMDSGPLPGPHGFGLDRRHPSGAEIMGLVPPADAPPFKESYQRIGDKNPNPGPIAVFFSGYVSFGANIWATMGAESAIGAAGGGAGGGAFGGPAGAALGAVAGFGGGIVQGSIDGWYANENRLSPGEAVVRAAPAAVEQSITGGSLAGPAISAGEALTTRAIARAAAAKASEEAAAQLTIKLAPGAKALFEDTAEEVLLGVVAKDGTVHLFKSGEGMFVNGVEILSHADLVAAGVVPNGAQGFSLVINQGRGLLMLMRNSALNAAKEGYLLSEGLAETILESLGANGGTIVGG